MNTPKTFKLVGFAYPTSPAATRFGFAKTGCHIVETFEIGKLGNCKTNILSGHASREDAVRESKALPFEWSPMFLRFGHPENLKLI